MKPVSHITAVAIALVLLLGAPGVALAAGASTSSDPTKGMSKSELADYLATHPVQIAKANADKASAQRAKDSSFERQPLDQKAFATNANAPKKAASGGGSIVRALFGLLVVGGLIFAIHFLLKKWGRARAHGGSGGASGVIDVVATTQLAQGRSVHLIRVGAEMVLVGATEQSITRLGEIDARGLGLAGIGTNQTGNFGSLLQGAIEVGPGSTPMPLAQLGSGAAAAVPSANPSFVGRFVENLKLNTAR